MQIEGSLVAKRSVRGEAAKETGEGTSDYEDARGLRVRKAGFITEGLDLIEDRSPAEKRKKKGKR